MNSIYDHKLEDENGPLPWFTYPCIEYLRQLDMTRYNVFEWGSGNSSLFFSKRCLSVDSVENDKEWFDKISSKKRENQCLFFLDGDAYIKAIDLSKKHYDVVLIDGSFRHECVVNSISKLKETQIVIFDNSNWYAESCELLRNETNFIQVDFHGMGPINDYGWTTSIFLNRNLSVSPLGGNQPQKPIAGNWFLNCGN